MAVGSVRFYFLEFIPMGRYGGSTGQTGTMIGHYLQELDGEYHAYLFGAPRIYWSFGTMSFLAPSVPGDDVVEQLTAPPDFVEEGSNAVFLFLPGRTRDLVWVQEAFPDGGLREFRDADGTLWFTAYEVPPGPRQ
jgi:hypothetical protein